MWTRLHFASVAAPVFWAMMAGAGELPDFETNSSLHRIRLKPMFIPQVSHAGVLAFVRVNGGPPLRLLLDSGARNLVLHRKAAARSGCPIHSGSPLELVGVGGNGPVMSTVATVDRVEVGPVTLRRVEVAVIPHDLMEGIDGVLPLALFSDYLVRLDLRAKMLELMPLAMPSADANVETIVDNRLLFVKVRVNDVHEGFFLLDTGSFYNAVSTGMAKRLRSSRSRNGVAAVHGASESRMDAQRVSEVLRFSAGSQQFPIGNMIAVDLSTVSRYHNFDVQGLLGYPALEDSVVTINYREKAVRIERK